MRFAPLMVIMMGLGMSVSAQDKAVSFEKDIVPIFKASCISCHKPDKKKGKLDMSTYADLMKLVPYKRIGEAEEIGRAAVWLASDFTDYVVGTTLFIEGGMPL